MEFALNSKIIESEKKDKINNAIILLHGYGGDGSDISSIAYTWKRFINKLDLSLLILVLQTGLLFLFLLMICNYTF